MIKNYVPIWELWQYMPEENRQKALDALPGIKGVIAFVFPYFAGADTGNISVYARGEDYHRVVGGRLEQKCGSLKDQYPQNTFLPYADASPFPEVYAAAKAGLGVVGKNNLLITPEYGSYVFIGLVATDLEAASAVSAINSCIGCRACINACPGGALKDTGFDKNACLSDITQRKGELTQKQTALIKANGTVWGCDRCQTVCPMNKNAKHTHISEFKDDLVCSLKAEDIPQTNREFKDKYGTRAFSWRGRSPLVRNLELTKEQGSSS